MRDLIDILKENFVVWLLMWISGYCFAYPIGRHFGREEIKQEAVDTGNATWTVDSKGVVQFNWKEGSK